MTRAKRLPTFSRQSSTVTRATGPPSEKCNILAGNGDLSSTTDLQKWGGEATLTDGRTSSGAARPSVEGRRTMRTVSIHWPDLEIAFERNAPDIESYLDLQSGEVISIVAGEADAAEKRARVSAQPQDFARIDSASSREQYQWMEKFVASVEDEALRERLVISIDGK